MSEWIEHLVRKARIAQEQVEFWPQERVDEMVAAVGWQLYQREHAEACARSAVNETGMGVYDDKVLKHQKKTLGSLRDLHGLKTTGVIEEDPARGLIKIAKPAGGAGRSGHFWRSLAEKWCVAVVSGPRRRNPLSSQMIMLPKEIVGSNENVTVGISPPP